MSHTTFRGAAAVATVILGALLVMGQGCAKAGGSSHHSWIRLSKTDDMSAADATGEFDDVVRIADAWAARNGLRREATGEPRRLSWATSAANGNEQTLYFREARPAGNMDMPVEVLIAFDPDGGTTSSVEVSMGEGYGKEPTPRLRELHDTLAADLQARFGERINARIW